MEKIFTQLLVMVSLLVFPTVSRAIDNNTVQIVYSGTTATVTTAGQQSVYDLQGRQVKTLGKGLYILNDGNTVKKVLIK